MYLLNLAVLNDDTKEVTRTISIDFETSFPHKTVFRKEQLGEVEGNKASQEFLLRLSSLHLRVFPGSSSIPHYLVPVGPCESLLQRPLVREGWQDNDTLESLEEAFQSAHGQS